MGVKEEKARQSCWCWTQSGRQLAPVKPTRCHKMFDECTAFSKRMTTCEQQIAALKKATDVLLATSEKVLTKPLPQVWENDAAGVEVYPVPNTGAPLTTPGRLQRSHSLELQSQVYDPLGSWQKEYMRIKARMAEVDKQSLRLDAARRAHYKGVQAHLKENVMKQDNTSARRPEEGDSPELVAARTSFYKIEGEVHEELTALEQKARDVQGYITKAMELQGKALLAAASTHAEPAAATTTAAAPAGETAASIPAPVAPAPAAVPAGTTA